jgi:sulfur-carrier protein
MPQHLRTLARVSCEVVVDVDAPVTVASVLDALEATHPSLRGTIRDRHSGRRPPMLPQYTAGVAL